MGVLLVLGLPHGVQPDMHVEASNARLHYKLDFAGPDTTLHTYRAMPFGPVNGWRARDKDQNTLQLYFALFRNQMLAFLSLDIENCGNFDSET